MDLLGLFPLYFVVYKKTYLYVIAFFFWYELIIILCLSINIIINLSIIDREDFTIPPTYQSIIL